jgi:hypothetical protein
MNQMSFVIAAYMVSVPVLVALTLSSLFAMRKAEKAAQDSRRDPDSRREM